MSEATVASLIKKLRKMHGHVSAKDKDTVVEAIGALTDLSVRLWKVTHVPEVPVPAFALPAAAVTQAAEGVI